MPTVTTHDRFSDLNVLAQMTDARLYMTNVTHFTPSQAEVIVGPAATLLGKIQKLLGGDQNKNRAFTPCLSFAWTNEVEMYVGLLAAGAGKATLDYVDQTIKAGANGVLVRVSAVHQSTIAQQAALAALAAQLAGTPLGNQILTAKTAVDDSVAQLSQAKISATVLSQDADDFATATQTAARLSAANDPAAAAATSMLQQTMDVVNTQESAFSTNFQSASASLSAAASALATLANQAAAQGASVDVVAAITAMRDALNSAVADAANLTGNILVSLAGTISGAVAGTAVAVLGTAVGEIFEFVAGGDIIMPSPNDDQHNVTDRGIPTHEYGHFVLCNLLNLTSPANFAGAYDAAAVQGLISKQSPSAISAVLNESFADLIASQVVGGTNYAAPSVSLRTPSGLFAYCDASRSDCIEANTDNTFMAGPTLTFQDEVLRDVSLFTDAFDGNLPVPLAIDRPMNGNEWQAGLQLAGSPGGDAADEIVSLSGAGFPQWIFHTMQRGTLLIEDNVFAGLSDAMTDQGYSWCARCEVFRLHTRLTDPMTGLLAPTCPERWVGSRPVNVGTTTPVTCTFEGCPAGSNPDPATRTCVVCPPGRIWDPTTHRCMVPGPP